MAFVVNFHSLSALKPVKFAYKYNFEEKLAETPIKFKGGLSYYDYKLFKNYKDAVLSKHNCLILSDVLPLSSIFENSLNQNLSIGSIGGCVFLKTNRGEYVTTSNNRVYVGGTGKKLFVNIVPISNNVVELKTNSSTYLQVDSTYPYTVSLSQEILDSSEISRRRFLVDYANNQITFKNNTADGYRFLSFNYVDKTLRAIGVELNESIINSYRFVTEFVSQDSIEYNFRPRMDEVKYFNELTEGSNQKTLAIKQAFERNANMLVSCPTLNISMSGDEATVLNIATVKTNFSSSNTYSIEKPTC